MDLVRAFHESNEIPHGDDEMSVCIAPPPFEKDALFQKKTGDRGFSPLPATRLVFPAKTFGLPEISTPSLRCAVSSSGVAIGSLQ